MTDATPAELAEPAQPSKPGVKVRKPRQRACDEKNEKGKLCMGHLKRWYDYPQQKEKAFGPGAELYRCERCQVIYTPDLNELPRSYTLRA